MDLREHTVYLRCTTRRDLLDDGTVLEVADTVASLTGEPFVASRDLGGPGRRPAAPRQGLTALEEMCGLGLHAGARIKISADPDPTAVAGVQALTIQAGAHPYTGRYVTSLDLRVPNERFDDPDFVERYVDFVADLTAETEPFVGHAHDTDDTAIQNMASRAILRSGFGIDDTELPEEGEIDVTQNPGIEVSRGELRYLASWLMIIGPLLRDDLGAEAVDALVEGEHVEELRRPTDGHLLLRLVRSPRAPASDLARTRQRAVRNVLGFDARATEKSYNWGYWDRKKRSL